MDLTALATSLSTTIGAAITSATPVAALVLGAFIGYRIFKHFVKG
jgi:hypothetical protein